MDKIICLVGPSGSGKTTVARGLEKEGYNIIQSYTTRKPRFEGEWGHTFIEEYKLLPGIGLPKDMIAYFNSYNSGHHYFAT
jgi:guanylate kinase